MVLPPLLCRFPRDLQSPCPVRSRASLPESAFVCPQWTALVEGLRPNQFGRDEWIPPIILRVGNSSQHRESNHFRAETVWPRWAPTEQALLRSQSGPMSGVAFSAVPSSPPIRVRRFLFVLFLTSRTCRCGRPLDPRGTTVQRVREQECWAVGGFFVESAAARVCRGAGAWVSTNLFVRVLDLLVAPHDARRLDVVADGLLLLAIDTTLVSSVRADGEPRGQWARHNGTALAETHRLKHRTYFEHWVPGRARLVVLAVEVSGRWSEEARSFVSWLARAKVRVSRGRTRQVLSCLAPAHERLPCPCWIVVLWVAMATPPRSRTLLPLATTCLTCRESFSLFSVRSHL